MAVLTDILKSIRPSSSAILWGAGSSASPFCTVAENKNFLAAWFNSTASSGDTRGLYLRLYLSGTGGGEAIRAYSTANATNVATGGTINGIHTTMSVATNSSVSGAGNAIRATLAAAAQSRTLGGTCAALQLDSDIGTGNTLPTTWSFVRVTDSGSVRCNTLFQLPAAANGTLVAAHTTDAMTHSIKCMLDGGTPIYIMCTTTSSNRS